jgi:hypothetical protein
MLIRILDRNNLSKRVKQSDSQVKQLNNQDKQPKNQAKDAIHKNKKREKQG